MQRPSRVAITTVTDSLLQNAESLAVARGRGAAAVARWRDRFERHPRAVLATVLVSAVVGLPPFYVVSVAAGAMGLQFRRFVFVGTLGRLLHFAAVAWMGR